MNRENKERNSTLQDLVDFTKISVATDAENPLYVNYAFQDHLETLDNLEYGEAIKREVEPVIKALKNDIQREGKIPEWASRQGGFLENYKRLHATILNQAQIADLINAANVVGYDPADFSNIVDPTEEYGRIAGDIQEISKREAIARINGENLTLNDEEKRIKDKGIAVKVLQEMTNKAIIFGFDTEYHDDVLDSINEKYAPQENQESA
ncbi:hypothetical protein CL621_00650 [archaeon]|nr:hypothetical protein [archaeon]|tara:strand:+ start:2067 stop:2693 length:627 start_codon:yes stop_codon:yes gene_type:complete